MKTLRVGYRGLGAGTPSISGFAVTLDPFGVLGQEPTVNPSDVVSVVVSGVRPREAVARQFEWFRRPRKPQTGLRELLKIPVGVCWEEGRRVEAVVEEGEPELACHSKVVECRLPDNDLETWVGVSLSAGGFFNQH